MTKRPEGSAEQSELIEANSASSPTSDVPPQGSTPGSPDDESSDEAQNMKRQYPWRLGILGVLLVSIALFQLAGMKPSWLGLGHVVSWFTNLASKDGGVPALVTIAGAALIMNWIQAVRGKKTWFPAALSIDWNSLRWSIGAAAAGFLAAVGIVTVLGTWWWFGGTPWSNREVDKVPSVDRLVKDSSDTADENTPEDSGAPTPQGGAGDWSFLYLNQPPSPLEVAQMAFAVTTTIGGAAFLVISYRKSRRDEEVEVREKKEEERAEHKAFAEHYGTAAEQLSSDDVTKQLAGLYAMANLARAHRPEEPATPEARRNTQQCVDMICSFVRLMEIPGAGSAPVGGLRGVSGDTDESAQSGATRREKVLSADQRRARNAQQTALNLLIDLMPHNPDDGAETDPVNTEEGKRGRRDKPDRPNKLNRYDFDLTGADLAKLDMGGDLWDKRGMYVRLKMFGADLRDAGLYGADLRDARLDGADLRGARLFRADLRGTLLSKADLRDARLGGADLRGTLLSKADLRGTLLSKADLRDARLFRADLRGAWLGKADLRGTRLGGADLRGAGLGRAKIDENQADTATLCMSGNGSETTMKDALGEDFWTNYEKRCGEDPPPPARRGELRQEISDSVRCGLDDNKDSLAVNTSDLEFLQHTLANRIFASITTNRSRYVKGVLEKMTLRQVTAAKIDRAIIRVQQKRTHQVYQKKRGKGDTVGVQRNVSVVGNFESMIGHDLVDVTTLTWTDMDDQSLWEGDWVELSDADLASIKQEEWGELQGEGWVNLAEKGMPPYVIDWAKRHKKWPREKMNTDAADGSDSSALSQKPQHRELTNDDVPSQPEVATAPPVSKRRPSLEPSNPGDTSAPDQERQDAAADQMEDRDASEGPPAS